MSYAVIDRCDSSRAVHAAAISTLRAERTTLIAYMRQRMDREDWHGVMDAAADIREIDAKLGVLEAR